MKKHQIGLKSIFVAAAVLCTASGALAAGAKCPSGGVPPSGSTVTGGLEVNGACDLNNVTIRGGVVIDSTGGLSLQNSTVYNGILVNGGELDLGHALNIVQPGSQIPNFAPNVINAGIVINGASDFDLDGATIHGGVAITGTIGAFPTVCATTINGSLTIADATIPGEVVIGDTEGDLIGFSCAANQINGALSISNVSGLVEVEANKITGSAIFLSDSFLEFNGNTIGGSAICTGSTITPPPSTDLAFGNTVKGPVNSCPN